MARNAFPVQPMSAGREDVIREFQRGRFRLIAYLRALVGDADLAEDLFQEVSVVVLKKAEEFIPGRDLHAWCRGIARNIVLRQRKSARRLCIFEDDRIVDLVDAAFEENADRELMDSRRTLLRKCLEALAPASREMVDLRYVSELSLRELSGRLERTEGAVQVALSRIRKWLSDCVERRVQPGPEISV